MGGSKALRWRWRLRTALVGVAVVAVLLAVVVGLQRRAEHFRRLYREHLGVASRLELTLVKGPPPADSKALLDRVHWHDRMAHRYKQAAARPWMPEPRGEN